MDPAENTATESAVRDPSFRAVMPVDQAALVARALKPLANATRLRILSVMLNSEGGHASVGEIADAVGLRQPSVTHHLNLLEDAGLVIRQPTGRQVMCSVSPEMLPIIVDLLG